MDKNILIFLLLIGFVSWSCTKDATEVFNEKRNNIVGAWDVTQASQEIRADTVAAESSSNFEITFNADESGVKQAFLLGTEVAFEWVYQFNPEKVVISLEQADILLSDVQFYDVIKNENDRQIWEYEVVLQNQVVDKYKHTWKMDRE